MAKPFAFILAFAAAAHAAEPTDLCRDGEQVVFGCRLGTKRVSVCASMDVSASSGYMQYRFGRPGKPEFVYPQGERAPAGTFHFSHAAFSGGGAARIRFVSEGFEYVVFDEMFRTNFKPGEPNDPKTGAGVIVRNNGKVLSIRRCRDDAAIRKLAYDVLLREEFDYGLIR